MLKDNIDTADRMQTTAGSLPLLNVPVRQDSTTAQRLRRAGAVLLGKTNLSEWANFRSTHSWLEWSRRIVQQSVCPRPQSVWLEFRVVRSRFSQPVGGRDRNRDGWFDRVPGEQQRRGGYQAHCRLDEPRWGIPISHTQDTIGPFGRTVADAATVLGAMTGVDARDAATSASAGRFFSDYRQFLDADALKGARIGVARDQAFGRCEKTDAIMESAIAALSAAGATIVEWGSRLRDHRPAVRLQARYPQRTWLAGEYPRILSGGWTAILRV